jgi:hypothetical protein
MRSLRTLVILSIILGAAVASCAANSSSQHPTDTAVAPAPGTTAVGTLRFAATPAPAPPPPSSYVCTTGFPQANFPYTIPFGPGVPPDIKTFAAQPVVDCFAWGEFIALNWSVEKAAGFGDPLDLGQVTWQTYPSASALFLEDGGAPPSLGDEPPAPAHCMEQAGVSAEAAKHLHVLSASSKLDATDPSSSFDIHQAAPGAGPNWLGAQNGTNVWYEVRVSPDEYSYVVDAGLYNADQQLAFVKAGNRVNLPMGCSPASGEQCDAGATLGALEVKAAWMEAPGYPSSDASANAQWQRYKLTSAVVVDPETRRCRQTTLALVGLHILHKTTSQPTWVWATFEQIDNVPAADVPAPNGYNFSNASCAVKPLTMPKRCLADGGTSDASVTVQIPCDGNPPPYNLEPGCPSPAPIQVTRRTPIDPNSAVPVNQASATGIHAYQASSVWQYYELVDVLWSTNSIANSGDGGTPRPFNSPTSGGASVANTTLETYAQSSICTDCHAFAPIARNQAVSSDFSFLFENAGPENTQRTRVRAHSMKLVKAVELKKR